MYKTLRLMQKTRDVQIIILKYIVCNAFSRNNLCFSDSALTAHFHRCTNVFVVDMKHIILQIRYIKRQISS